MTTSNVPSIEKSQFSHNYPAQKEQSTPSEPHLASHCASSLPLAASEPRMPASSQPAPLHSSYCILESFTMSEGSRHVWSHPETLALIDAWEERYEVLRSQRRTAHVHEDIRQALSALKVDKSIRQIVVKIDNLTQKYRKTKMSGKANPTWVYFKRLDKFMGLQTRYGRRRGIRGIKKQQEDDVDVEDDEETQDSTHSISIASVQSSCDVDLLHHLEQNGVANYREDLMNIIANQLEVQRQSLVVQEKVITLMRTIVANSVGDMQVPKTETG